MKIYYTRCRLLTNNFHIKAPSNFKFTSSIYNIYKSNTDIKIIKPYKQMNIYARIA